MMRFFVHLFRNLLWSLLSVLLLFTFVGAGLYVYLVSRLPEVATLKDINLQVPLHVYSSDNKLIGEFGEKKRQPISIDKVPKTLIQAVLATEDQRFYEHPGVDFI